MNGQEIADSCRKGGIEMKKYLIEEALKASGYTRIQIEEMSDIEAYGLIIENNYRECKSCGLYVHTDDFNGEQDLCDGCI